MIRVRFDIQKKIQAAALLARLEGGRVDRVRLLKLLYIADRDSLAERGIPIIGGRVAALDNGPLHCDVYSMIKSEGEHDAEVEAAREWGVIFKNDNHSIVLKTDPEILDLSEFEVEKLTDAWDRHKDLDTWELVEKTHEFEEWKRFQRTGSSHTIPMESILSAVGYNIQDIAAIQREADAHGRLQKSLERSSACGAQP